MAKDEKMTVTNHKGVFYYPYTQVKNRKVYYDTKKYPENGMRERQRRIRQTLAIMVKRAEK